MCRIFWEQYECCCIHILSNSVCCQDVLHAHARTSIAGDLIRDITPRGYDWYCIGLEIEGYWVYGDCPCCESSTPFRPCTGMQILQKDEEQHQPFLRTNDVNLARRFVAVLVSWRHNTQTNAQIMRQALNSVILQRDVEVEQFIRQRRHAGVGGPERLNVVLPIARRILEQLRGQRRMAH